MNNKNIRTKWGFLLVLCLLALQAVGASGPSAQDLQPISPFKSDKDKTSYAMGASVGRNFKKQGFEINQAIFDKGLKDALAGDKLELSEQEFKSVVNNVQSEIRRKMVANRREATIENKKKGDEFLAENKKKEGIVTLPSGLQYKIIKAGNGKLAQDINLLVVNYHGTLLDGTEFDASEPGKPVNLKMAQLIPGWREAMKLMPVGSKWKLFIPPQLAYAERGVGNDIGPNETLLFEVELVDLK
jgi:FKBP-type peptidyl-prolyl cis-trans isomerase FklB